MNEVKIGYEHKREGSAVITRPLSYIRFAVELSKAVAESHKATVKIYDMEIQNGPMKYQVKTGSKDVFLLLGRMGSAASRSLMTLINSQTQEENDILVTFHHEGSTTGFICGVSRPAPDAMNVVISQAHS